MKLAKYISVAVTTLVLFVVSWILTGLDRQISSFTVYFWGVLFGSLLLVNSIGLASICAVMLINSIKKSLSFRKENGLWKILTLAFGIGMTVLAGLIAIFSLVFIIYALKDGVFGSSFSFETEDGLDEWAFRNLIAGLSFIKGDEIAQSMTFCSLYVTSFVFILLWCAAGITFEVLKKVLGGNKSHESSSNAQSSTKEQQVQD